MPDGVRIEITGLKELQARIHAMRDVEISKQLRLTNLKAAEMVAQGARFYAPRDTGRLMQSIRPKAGQTWAEVDAGGGAVPYASVIHWGWAARNIAATKFIYRSADESKTDVTRAYSEDMDRLMDTIRA